MQGVNYFNRVLKPRKEKWLQSDLDLHCPVWSGSTLSSLIWIYTVQSDLDLHCPVWSGSTLSSLIWIYTVQSDLNLHCPVWSGSTLSSLIWIYTVQSDLDLHCPVWSGSTLSSLIWIYTVQSDLDLHCQRGLKNISADDLSCIGPLWFSVCIRSQFSWNAHTSAWLKQLINHVNANIIA